MRWSHVAATSVSNISPLVRQEHPRDRRDHRPLHGDAGSRDVSVETIRGWHKANRWADIGYHWVVLLDGMLARGRPEAKLGAHVVGRNERTLGIVYVGGVASDGKTAKDTRTASQRETLLEACRTLIAKYPTIRKVSGHNQYAAKACPSFDVPADPLGHLV